MKICVLGMGAWGTAISKKLAQNTKSDIFFWDRNPSVCHAITQSHINPIYFPNVLLPKNIKAISSLNELEGMDLVILVIPSQFVRDLLKHTKPYLKKEVAILICSKGIENSSNMLLTDVVAEEVPYAKVAVLAGPNFAEEVINDYPSATLIGCTDFNLGKEIIAAFFNQSFRCYYSFDIMGIQLIGAAKNVLAVATGISTGMGYKENTKAMIVARGVAEIARILAAFNCNEKTLQGLAGVGDIMLTCNSSQSRNNSFGMKIGQGLSVIEALGNTTVEGYYSCKAMYEICEKHAIDAPIIYAMYHLLHGGVPLKQVVNELLCRGKSHFEFR